MPSSLAKDELEGPVVFAKEAGLLQGTLELLVLKTLSWGPMHGYGIASWIESATDDVLRVEAQARRFGPGKERGRGKCLHDVAENVLEVRNKRSSRPV